MVMAIQIAWLVGQVILTAEDQRRWIWNLPHGYTDKHVYVREPV